MTGNIIIARDKNNVVCLKRTSELEPSKNIDSNEISELLSNSNENSYRPFMRY